VRGPADQDDAGPLAAWAVATVAVAAGRIRRTARRNCTTEPV